MQRVETGATAEDGGDGFTVWASMKSEMLTEPCWDPASRRESTPIINPFPSSWPCPLRKSSSLLSGESIWTEDRAVSEWGEDSSQAESPHNRLQIQGKFGTRESLFCLKHKVHIIPPVHWGIQGGTGHGLYMELSAEEEWKDAGRWEFI